MTQFGIFSSLFRLEIPEEVETRFVIYKDKVPVLVQIAREVIYFARYICKSNLA